MRGPEASSLLAEFRRTTVSRIQRFRRGISLWLELAVLGAACGICLRFQALGLKLSATPLLQ